MVPDVTAYSSGLVMVILSISHPISYSYYTARESLSRLIRHVTARNEQRYSPASNTAKCFALGQLRAVLPP